MDISQGFTELRLSLAEARSRLRAAKDSHDLAKAEAENKAILAGLANGKNAEERSRALTLILAHDDDYLPALGNLRHCEHEVDRLEALLEGARDARRIDEWRVRAQLVDVLNRAGVASDSQDRAGDQAFDDVVDQRQVGMLETALRSRSEGVLLAERSQLNGHQRQGQTEEDVHWQQHAGTYDRGTDYGDENLPF